MVSAQFYDVPTIFALYRSRAGFHLSQEPQMVQAWISLMDRKQQILKKLTPGNIVLKQGQPCVIIFKLSSSRVRQAQRQPLLLQPPQERPPLLRPAHQARCHAEKDKREDAVLAQADVVLKGIRVRMVPGAKSWELNLVNPP